MRLPPQRQSRHFSVSRLLLTRTAGGIARLKPESGQIRVSGEAKASESDGIALRPGEDCWRIERADRAAALIDAEC